MSVDSIIVTSSRKVVQVGTYGGQIIVLLFFQFPPPDRTDSTDYCCVSFSRESRLVRTCALCKAKLAQQYVVQLLRAHHHCHILNHELRRIKCSQLSATQNKNSNVQRSSARVSTQHSAANSMHGMQQPNAIAHAPSSTDLSQSINLYLYQLGNQSPQQLSLYI